MVIDRNFISSKSSRYAATVKAALPNLLGMAHPSRQHAGRSRASAVVATAEVETAGDDRAFQETLGRRGRNRRNSLSQRGAVR